MEIRPYLRKVHFYETDAMGIVHHSNYIRWFEEARVDFMDQMGYSYARCAECGVAIAVIGVQCEYKGMVSFGDTVRIRVAIVQMSPIRMTVGYEITDAQGSELKTTGKSTHCFLDSQTHGIVRLNRALPELYALFGLAVKKE